jgi:hypothetical protein
MNRLILLFLSFSLLAEIREIKELREVLSYLEAGTCCLCDIDNTVLEPAREDLIGSDQWFNELCRYYRSLFPHEIALQLAIDKYCCVSLYIPMKSVEENTAQIIHAISSACVCIGFTMRSLVVAPKAVRHLADLQIAFTHYFHDHGFMIDEKYPVMMYQNVLFCQGKKCGRTLFEVFGYYGYEPSRILMIDDKMQYLLDMQDECEKRHIEFIGLRYGYLDGKVKEFVFDPVIHFPG